MPSTFSDAKMVFRKAMSMFIQQREKKFAFTYYTFPFNKQIFVYRIDGSLENGCALTI